MKPHKILVVDDEDAIRRLIARVLKRDGHVVMTAESVRAAEHLLKYNKADLIICDYMMPGEDGLSFLQRLKSHHPRMQRVLISGVADIDITVKAINQAQVHYCFLKPFEPAELCCIIRDLLGCRGPCKGAPVRVVTRARQKELDRLSANHPGISYVRRDTRGAVLLDGDYDDLMKGVDEWSLLEADRPPKVEAEVLLDFSEEFSKLINV